MGSKIATRLAPGHERNRRTERLLRPPPPPVVDGALPDLDDDVASFLSPSSVARITEDLRRRVDVEAARIVDLKTAAAAPIVETAGPPVVETAAAPVVEIPAPSVGEPALSPGLGLASRVSFLAGTRTSVREKIGEGALTFVEIKHRMARAREI